MTTLEIISITVIWLSYGIFNSWQHNWHGYVYNEDESPAMVFFNVALAPIALFIRIIRGVFFWKGDY